MGVPLIILIAEVVLAFFLGIFYSEMIKPYINDIRETKKVHRKKLIDEILRPLTFLSIRYDYKDFRVWIDGLEVLEEKGDLFVCAFKHLESCKKYNVILPSFETSKIDIKELIAKLKELKLYLNDNIEMNDREIIPYISREMVRSVFFEDTDVDCIKIKEVKDKNIYIYRNNEDTFRIPYILYEKTEDLISGIIEQKEFINQLKKIREIDRNAKKELEIFTGQLKTFLEDIEHNSKLKGKCEVCSLQIKLFWRLLIDRLREKYTRR